MVPQNIKNNIYKFSCGIPFYLYKFVGLAKFALKQFTDPIITIIAASFNQRILVFNIQKNPPSKDFYNYMYKSNIKFNITKLIGFRLHKAGL
ncbi:hypothetical protein TH63_18480 [Rufibacter radiotolerans]|uniref:Uncharacterized protein n=1 Tax=Rufibacter radiotolerans TaxID=1379910 RepID=A0A0H4W9N8_9BACT|nr:hypothetical protein TH63_18480 [Rufibacter radiotolerans]